MAPLMGYHQTRSEARSVLLWHRLGSAFQHQSMPPKHLEGCADTLTSSLSEQSYALVSSDK